MRKDTKSYEKDTKKEQIMSEDLERNYEETIAELETINLELSKERKRKIKKLPKFIIDDIFTKSIIKAIEEKYRYIFTDEEIEKEDEKLLCYIKSFPYLEEHFYQPKLF